MVTGCFQSSPSATQPATVSATEPLMMLPCLAFNAVCVAVEMGFARSLVLSTLPRPTIPLS